MSETIWLMLHGGFVGGTDLLLCYFTINRLMGRNMAKSFSILNLKNGLLGGLYFIILMATNILSSVYNLSHPSFIITTVLMFILTFSLAKSAKSKYSFDEVILMFLTYFILSQLIFNVSMVPFIIINGPTQLAFLIPLITITSLALFIINQIKLDVLLTFVAHRLAFKIAIFVISLTILLVSVFILISYSPHIFTLSASLLSLIIIISLGLAHTLKIAHQYEVVIPEKYNDMKKILTLLNLEATETQTTEDLQEMIKTTIELMGIKVEKPATQPTANMPADFTAFIQANIDSLKLNHNTTVDIRTNIQFFEAHKTVNAMNVNYMLSTLLENAFETGTTYPIIIDVLSTEHILLIKVANECAVKDPSELKSMLSKGFSTKGRIGRGFGLPKLKKLVESHQGTITISQEMNATEQVNYLSITLNF